MESGQKELDFLENLPESHVSGEIPRDQDLNNDARILENIKICNVPS